MTANEVAAFLKLNRATVYRLVKRKGLPSFRVGRDHRFRRAEIDEWIEAREKGARKTVSADDLETPAARRFRFSPQISVLSPAISSKRFIGSQFEIYTRLPGGTRLPPNRFCHVVAADSRVGFRTAEQRM